MLHLMIICKSYLVIGFEWSVDLNVPNNLQFILFIFIICFYFKE